MNIKKIKPMFNRILVTADVYTKDECQGKLIINVTGTVKEYQRVIAIGSTVRDIKVGDYVLINPSRYLLKRHEQGSLKDGVIGDNPITKVNFNMIKVDGKNCIMLYDQDVDYIIEEYEEVPDPTPSNLIIPEEKKFIC